MTASRLKTRGILDRNKNGYFISATTLLNAKAELEEGHKTHKKAKKARIQAKKA